MMSESIASQVQLAISALLAYLKDEKTKVSKKDELFTADDYIWMLIGFRKIPQVGPKPKKIPISHSIHAGNRICLISKEPGKVVKAKLAEKGVTSVKKVISLTKLRKEFKTFALKRQLASLYDVFLCDERIYHHASKTLGKEFFKKKKEPIPIRLSYPDWKTEISKCVNSTLLRMGHGPCSAVKVGCLAVHNEKELVENIIHAMTVCASKIPGEWKNIKSVFIKSSSSVSLPIYQASPLADVKIEEIKDPVPEQKKIKKKKVVVKTPPAPQEAILVDDADDNTNEKKIAEVEVPAVSDFDEEVTFKKEQTEPVVVTKKRKKSVSKANKDENFNKEQSEPVVVTKKRKKSVSKAKEDDVVEKAKENDVVKKMKANDVVSKAKEDGVVKKAKTNGIVKKAKANDVVKKVQKSEESVVKQKKKKAKVT